MLGSGEGGREVKAIFNGIPKVVGITDASLRLEEPEFTKVYETLAGLAGVRPAAVARVDRT